MPMYIASEDFFRLHHMRMSGPAICRNACLAVFGGCAYFDQKLPCDVTTLVKFRGLLGEESVEELLAQTINAAVSMSQAIEPFIGHLKEDHRTNASTSRVKRGTA